LVNDTHIDAVFIAASNSFHKAHAISCLENIKAVLCEKKIVMNLQEVAEIISVAKENKVLLMKAMRPISCLIIGMF
jgi:predicted dehydrogenase